LDDGNINELGACESILIEDAGWEGGIIVILFLFTS
jgi:hypothetical protein